MTIVYLNNEKEEVPLVEVQSEVPNKKWHKYLRELCEHEETAEVENPLPHFIFKVYLQGSRLIVAVVYRKQTDCTSDD